MILPLKDVNPFLSSTLLLILATALLENWVMHLVLAIIVSLPCRCVSGLPGVMSKSSNAERENFLVQVEWLPMTFHCMSRHGRSL